MPWLKQVKHQIHIFYTLFINPLQNFWMRYTSVVYNNKALSSLTMSWDMSEFAKYVYDSYLDVTTLVQVVEGQIASKLFLWLLGHQIIFIKTWIWQYWMLSNLIYLGSSTKLCCFFERKVCDCLCIYIIWLFVHIWFFHNGNWRKISLLNIHTSIEGKLG